MSPEAAEHITVREIAPGTPAYAEAKRVRYDALYREWGLPRSLVEDTDGRTYRHFAAYDESALVGYARLYLDDATPRISQVAVARDRRGEGIGALLMRTLMGVAREAGHTEIALDARSHVIPFYARLGFEVSGEEFISARTGTPHKPMKRPLERI